MLSHLASLQGALTPEPLEEPSGDLPRSSLIGVLPRRSEEVQQDHPAVVGALGLVLALGASGAGEPLWDHGRAWQKPIVTITTIIPAGFPVAAAFTCSMVSSASPWAGVGVAVVIVAVLFLCPCSLPAFSIATPTSAAAAVAAASSFFVPFPN